MKTTLTFARFLLRLCTLAALPCEAREFDLGARFSLPARREDGPPKIGRRERARLGGHRQRAEIGRFSRSSVLARPARLPRTRGPNTASSGRARRVPLLLFSLLFLTSLAASSCASSTPDVSGRWTGVLALNYGSGYDVELNLEQEEGGDLSGTGTLLARDAGEDDGQIDVVEGSRATGDEIDLVLRDATGFAGLRIDLRGTAEESRIEARGTLRASGGVAQNGLAANLALER